MCYVSEKLQEATRNTDTVARLGGDEFAVILTHLDKDERVAWVAERIVSVLAEPVTLSGCLIKTGTSIGISLYPRDGDNEEELLRTADAAGIDAVIVCDRCTDLWNPNVVRASVGTLFTVPVAEGGSEEVRRWLVDRGIRIVATTPDTETLHWEADLAGATAIVVGSEQYGLDLEWLDQADERIRIPMKGDADSLNAAISAAVVLFEALRQRAPAG